MRQRPLLVKSMPQLRPLLHLACVVLQGGHAFLGVLIKRFRWFICYIYQHTETLDKLIWLHFLHSGVILRWMDGWMDGNELEFFFICFSTGLLTVRQKMLLWWVNFLGSSGVVEGDLALTETRAVSLKKNRIY